jgi:tetratricopeptide (TPR) repeat protein
MDDAISALEQTVNMDSRAESSRDLLANVYMRRGRGTEAEALYARVLALRPGDSWARCGLGRVTFVAGRTEEGLADLSQAARESPGNVDIRREYALALFSNGKFDAAIAELMSAADARPARRKELDGLMQELSRRMHELPMPLQHRGP